MGGIISNTVYYTGNTPGQVAISRCLDKCWESYTSEGHENMTYA